MASQGNDMFLPHRSFTADADIVKHTAVKLGTVAHHCTTAGDEEAFVGIAARGCVSGDFCDVILLAPTIMVLADAKSGSGDAITVGLGLQCGASGIFIKAEAEGEFQITALEALASGTGYIEAILIGGTAATS